ncbi:MAG: fumarate hydratase C-terminal domain-containing protein [Elusimicrobia bacterium]|nr:fumarate hydratase C-terminal domain-containing protein [Elusimicrobiota bacterium]
MTGAARPFQRGRCRRLGGEGVGVSRWRGKEVLVVKPEALERLAYEAVRDVSFLMRTAHQKQVAAILADPAASANDRAVALALLENSAIAAKLELPGCQDTGTATVVAWKGEAVWTGADDALHLSKGVWQAYASHNLRYSQLAPLTMYDERNTGDNLPAQIDIHAGTGMAYDFLFITKGGGCANKTQLFQETKARLTPEALTPFLIEKMRGLGTAACPPYHLVFVVGGTSAEACLKTVKLASAGFLDNLPARGSKLGRAFRDRAMEAELLAASRQAGYGAQFGGTRFAHDVRVVRLPRHGASCPIGVGVSCSADRNVLGRIDRDGVWLEKLEADPGRLIPPGRRRQGRDPGAAEAGGRASRPPSRMESADREAVSIALDRPMKDILADLSKHPVGSRLLLTGRLVVARDIAHAKLKERLDRGEGLPRYFMDHPVYYAGPAKRPAGKPSGSFGPTTSGRMDAYVDDFMAHGASMIMIGKGNRAPAVTRTLKKRGGFYLGSIGGAAAILAERCIRKVEVIDYPELGMEAVWAIDVEDFPAWILIDDKGNDFFEQQNRRQAAGFDSQDSG